MSDFRPLQCEKRLQTGDEFILILFEDPAGVMAEQRGSGSMAALLKKDSIVVHKRRLLLSCFQNKM